MRRVLICVLDRVLGRVLGRVLDYDISLTRKSGKQLLISTDIVRTLREYNCFSCSVSSQDAAQGGMRWRVFPRDQATMTLRSPAHKRAIVCAAATIVTGRFGSVQPINSFCNFMKLTTA